jgi:hypothetical protein
MKSKDKKSNPKEKTSVAVNRQGEVRLKIETSEDHVEVNRFCEILKEISNLSIKSYNWSEKEGLNIFISLKDPMSLDEKLLRIPLVKKVDSGRKSLTVVLGDNLSDNSPTPRETTGEETFFS